MNSQSLSGAVRGPILMIVLGLLFAADHFGGYGIESTWPVLIIVYGALKLIERVAGASADNPAPPAGGYQ